MQDVQQLDEQLADLLSKAQGILDSLVQSYLDVDEFQETFEEHFEGMDKGFLVQNPKLFAAARVRTYSCGTAWVQTGCQSTHMQPWRSTAMWTLQCV